MSSGFQIWCGDSSINVVGIICPLVRIGLTETQISGWARAHPAHPLTTYLHLSNIKAFLSKAQFRKFQHLNYWQFLVSKPFIEKKKPKNIWSTLSFSQWFVWWKEFFEFCFFQFLIAEMWYLCMKKDSEG